MQAFEIGRNFVCRTYYLLVFYSCKFIIKRLSYYCIKDKQNQYGFTGFQRKSFELLEFTLVFPELKVFSYISDLNM